MCKGELVVPCPVCKGTGTDQFASYVAGVREMAGEETAANAITVDDWDSGPRQVVLFKVCQCSPPPLARSPSRPPPR